MRLFEAADAGMQHIAVRHHPDFSLRQKSH
jgi:hypothetical protein